jgi:hypothetical protein
VFVRRLSRDPIDFEGGPPGCKPCGFRYRLRFLATSKRPHWLSTPLPLFDNRLPAELLATNEGMELVERILTRIEHNIPS